MKSRVFYFGSVPVAAYHLPNDGATCSPFKSREQNWVLMEEDLFVTSLYFRRRVFCETVKSSSAAGWVLYCDQRSLFSTIAAPEVLKLWVWDKTCCIEDTCNYRCYRVQSRSESLLYPGAVLINTTGILFIDIMVAINTGILNQCIHDIIIKFPEYVVS